MQAVDWVENNVLCGVKSTLPSHMAVSISRLIFEFLLGPSWRVVIDTTVK